MKKFIKEHLIQTWIVASIVFAILIHILFVTDAPCDKLQAQWSAGDILTYTSTVALGLLAVWQNQKFKEENDKSQERLEKLSIQANELQLISKIIDGKQDRIENIRQHLGEFSELCNFGRVASMIGSDSDGLALSASRWIDHAYHIDLLGNTLRRELLGNTGVSYDVLIQRMDTLGTLAATLSMELSRTALEQEKRDTVDGEDYLDAFDDYKQAQDEYLQKCDRLLNRLLYENLSISEIREMLSTLKAKSKEDVHEQAENANPQPDSPEH